MLSYFFGRDVCANTPAKFGFGPLLSSGEMGTVSANPRGGEMFFNSRREIALGNDGAEA